MHLLPRLEYEPKFGAIMGGLFFVTFLIERTPTMMLKKETKPKFRGLKLKIFHKLLLLLALMIIPLIILGYLTNRNMAKTGLKAVSISQEMGARNLEAAREIGNRAILDSVAQLDKKATQAIEQLTIHLAHRIADFLYERDRDIRMLSAMPPDPAIMLNIYRACQRPLITPKVDAVSSRSYHTPPVDWVNSENRVSWRHRPPAKFDKKKKPIYKEITFFDLSGMEKIKIFNNALSDNLKDISKRENTYCKAENYFSQIQDLSKGEIFVSRVIGAYQKGWLYKTDKGVAVKPASAYAGRENQGGAPFEGIIRWVTPVYQDDVKLGYYTMAMDHAHLMEFTDHIVPTEALFTSVSDASTGNYAFLWDDRDQCISHPRDFFICGYDPETGMEVPGWISQQTYEEFRNSGLSLTEFVRNLPSFRNFTQHKSGSREQINNGTIALDCRILDTAPQCQGWHRGTEDGGSGSFLILWSGLWKLTTYAAVPYYTGHFNASPRGFGYVTIGAHVEDFHKAANTTRAGIENSIDEQSRDIQQTQKDARELIIRDTTANRKLIALITIASTLLLICVAIIFSLTITRPLKRLTQGAEAISRGDYYQHIDVHSGDEVEQLAHGFNQMAATVAEVDRMKSEFVTIASHELRTPIHAMLLSVSGILEGYSGEINEEVREDLLIVNQGIARLMSLVENLLDLSRIEARKSELNITREALEQIINAAIKELSQLIETSRHQVRKAIARDIPDLLVDRKKITQVIINLLSNAIKYTSAKGVIIISAEKNEKEVILSIADNGYGIPEWAHASIFDKFFQADSIMSQKVGGSGLGLTIAKGLVEEHGGRIDFESPVPRDRFRGLPLDKKRKGTVFTIHLPIENTRSIDKT